MIYHYLYNVVCVFWICHTRQKIHNKVHDNVSSYLWRYWKRYQFIIKFVSHWLVQLTQNTSSAILFNVFSTIWSTEDSVYQLDCTFQFKNALLICHHNVFSRSYILISHLEIYRSSQHKTALTNCLHFICEALKISEAYIQHSILHHLE